MSLLERVTSVECLSPEGGRTSSPSHSPHPPHHHKLSFNPIPRIRRPEDNERGNFKVLGAFEVPKGKRVVQIVTAVLYCLVSSGIVFGYAALKPILIHTHVYGWLCTSSEVSQGVRVCYEQDLRLNLMFIVATVGTNVGALPIGAILDAFGPRVCACIGSVLIFLGAILFSYADELSRAGTGAGIDGYIPGYLCLAIGGSFVFLSSMHLSCTFPRHSGLILALLTGAFDSSTAVFLGYRMLYQWSDGVFDPGKFFAGYLVVPAMILLAQLLWMPSKAYKSVGELVKQVEDLEELTDDQVEEGTNLLREDHYQHHSAIVSETSNLLGSRMGSAQKEQEQRRHDISGVWGAMHGKSNQQQISSPWFILMTLFTILQMMRINLFMATIRQQYTWLLGSYPKAVEVGTFFDIALPLGGILGIPFIGLILDNTSTFSVLLALVTLSTTIGVLGVLPYTWAAYANISLFVLYRPFYYTTVSDYTAKVFGFLSFGTVYGLTICLSGLFNFVQSGLDVLTHQIFNRNPVPVNLMLLGAGLVVGAALCAFVGFRTSKMKREGLVEEAERARESVMPGAREVDRL